MLRRLLGLLVLAFCALVVAFYVFALVPALPGYAVPVALLLWLCLRHIRRGGPSSLGSERQSTDVEQQG